jgi:hypothetical protein
MGISSRINLIMEEVFPFLAYRNNKTKLMSKLENTKIDSTLLSYDRYYSLPHDKLSERITEERQRAVAMDDKTFKLTLSLTIALTLLGTTMQVLAKDIANDVIKLTFQAEVLISILYILIGGLIALGALKTLPSYGYGTDFSIHSKSKRHLIEALVSQEIMNNVRHLRNEASYQCLRNGVVLLFVAIFVYIGASVISGYIYPFAVSCAVIIKHAAGNVWGFIGKLFLCTV